MTVLGGAGGQCQKAHGCLVLRLMCELAFEINVSEIGVNLDVRTCRMPGLCVAKGEGSGYAGQTCVDEEAARLAWGPLWSSGWSQQGRH